MTEDTAQCRELAHLLMCAALGLIPSSMKKTSHQHKTTSAQLVLLMKQPHNVLTGKHGPVCLWSLTIHQAWVICTFTYLSDMGKMLIFILQRSLMP